MKITGRSEGAVSSNRDDRNGYGQDTASNGDMQGGDVAVATSGSKNNSSTSNTPQHNTSNNSTNTNGEGGGDGDFEEFEDELDMSEVDLVIGESCEIKVRHETYLETREKYHLPPSPSFLSISPPNI